MSKEALKLALEALEHSHANEPIWKTSHREVITAIKQALEQPVQEFVCSTGLCHYRKPQQEPVAWMDASGDIYKNELWHDWNPPHTPLYATPPAAQRPWVGLSDEEFRDFASTPDYGTGGLIRAIEAKLKELNA